MNHHFSDFHLRAMRGTCSNHAFLQKITNLIKQLVQLYQRIATICYI